VKRDDRSSLSLSAQRVAIERFQRVEGEKLS
jgi:hypothetical protein